jgi:hypothetical protein
VGDDAQARPRGRKGAVVAVLAGVSSVVLFAVYFMWWWSLPDLMWQLGLGLALLAVVVGLVSSGRTALGPRGGPLAAVGGLVGALLGALVLAYFVLVLYTAGSD